ncbi:MAG TPA: HEAT repeat domain-containing protein [Candidatus Limnocylindrales bacterium]|nr:HEAT repeat domain-containing protein [Candidatus Limnocylindrales bacterium]
MLVLRTIWGAGAGSMALVYTLDPGIPDAPMLERGEECLVALRWVDAAAEPWASRLQEDNGRPTPAAGLVGVLAAGGKLQVGPGVADDIERWVRGARARGREPGFDDLALRLLDHPLAVIRRSVLDELTLLPGLLEGSAMRPRLAASFDREWKERLDPGCLRGWVSLARAREIAEAAPALLGITLSDDAALSVQAAAALSRVASATERASLLEAAVREPLRVQVRALEALGHAGVEEAVPVLRRALESGTMEARQAAIEGLSRLKSPVATQALASILDGRDDDSRRAALSALRLQRTRESYRLLRTQADPPHAISGTSLTEKCLEVLHSKKAAHDRRGR